MSDRWSCALIADVHANLPALEAVLADVESRDLDAVYHLGDLVGYAPWPNEVVERLAGIPGVAGNYDSTVATGADHCGCRSESPEQEALATASYAWTVEHVSAETRKALGALPFRLDVRPAGGHRAGPTLRLIHGTPTRNTVYWDESRSDDFARDMGERLGAREGDMVAFGHTHVPWVRRVDGIAFANAGSVGRPKDGDPRASWAIATWDGETLDVEPVRTVYDVERAAEAIVESELPDAFAEDLRNGGAKPDPARSGAVP